MIDRFERFSLNITEIYRCWHKIAGEEMRRYDIKGSYAVYFTTLYRFPEGLTAVQLGEFCSRDKADVSRAIALLEKKNLIQRSCSDTKVYRASLTLTQEGIAAAEHINKRAMVAVEAASQGLPEDKRVIFYEALERITGNLQQISKEGLPQV